MFFGPGTIVTMEDLRLVIKSQLFAYYSEQCSDTVSANDTDRQPAGRRERGDGQCLKCAFKYVGTR